MNAPQESNRSQIHEIRVFDQTLASIKRGEKTHDVRIAHPQFTKIMVGDSISFGDGVVKKVVAIEYFDSIETCIERLGIAAILPGFTSDQIIGVWSTRPDVRINFDNLPLIAFKLE